MSWSAKSLDELGTVSRGRSRHRPRDAAHLYGGPYPFVQTGDVKRAGLYLTEYSQTYSDEGLAQSKLWPSGTLCITIAANIADTSILAIDACFPDSVIGFIPDPKKSDARFIKYLFDAVLKLQYRQVSQGAAQDNLSQGKLLALKFSVPDDVNEQIRIADFIATYDDLIDNNRRRIQLLEESARLLYQEWFVHLRFPGHKQVEIVDGVPEGWEESTLGSLASVQSGYAFKSKDWLETGNPVIKIKNITGDGTVETKDCQYVDDNVAEKAQKFKLESGDFLIAMTGATVGKVGIMPKSSQHYFLNQRVGKFLFLNESASEFVFCLTSTRYFKTQIENLAGGAAQPNISGKQIESIKVLLPSKKLLSLFSEHTRSLFEQRQLLVESNKKLAQARDLLLPKLMSGELTV
ncbi:TPA: restriction endonuclease subunit S [Vibrio cholerae]|nr:restriction endonuclease subunit S [Vibrio cholerae]